MANSRPKPGSKALSLTASAADGALVGEGASRSQDEFECIEGELVEPAPQVHVVEQPSGSGRAVSAGNVTVVVSVGTGEAEVEPAPRNDRPSASEAAWLLDLNRGVASSRRVIPHHRAVASYAAYATE